MDDEELYVDFNDDTCLWYVYKKINERGLSNKIICGPHEAEESAKSSLKELKEYYASEER